MIFCINWCTLTMQNPEGKGEGRPTRELTIETPNWYDKPHDELVKAFRGYVEKQTEANIGLLGFSPPPANSAPRAEGAVLEELLVVLIRSVAVQFPSRSPPGFAQRPPSARRSPARGRHGAGRGIWGPRSHLPCCRAGKGLRRLAMGNRGGAIVNLASIACDRRGAGVAIADAASKGGVVTHR